MKIRTDFVTNSSSSSFILARKGQLTNKQKDIIIDYVESALLGQAIITPDQSEEEIQKILVDFSIEEDDEDAVRKALKSGKTIYYGAVHFEDAEEDHVDLFEELWGRLEQTDEFETIDGTLEY